MARPLVDSWYGWSIDGVDSFAAWIDGLPAPAARAVKGSGALRGLVLAARSARRPCVATIRTDPGWRSLLLARALFGRRRKLVVLNFIRHPLREGGAAGAFDRAWERVDRLAIRRALLAGHVLTEFERDELSAWYGLPADRFTVVHHAARRTAGDALPPAPDEPMVLSSGRAFCDWDTLFAAARGAGWPLTVVCAGAEREHVAALARDTGATVLSDLDPAAHRDLLARATVAAVVMSEAGISQGHVRLMDAAQAGVAVVATATRSLAGYAQDGATALLVAPGEPAALRAAIDRLLSDDALRERIRAQAWERSQAWAMDDYLAAIGELVVRSCGARAASSR